jgi:hypothetical protein
MPKQAAHTGERIFAEAFHCLNKLQINLVRNGHDPSSNTL